MAFRYLKGPLVCALCVAILFLLASPPEAHAAAYCGCNDYQGKPVSTDLAMGKARFQQFCQKACSYRPSAPSNMSSGTSTGNAALQLLPGIINMFSNPNAEKERADRAAATAAYERQRARQQAEEARKDALAARQAQDQIANARTTVSNPWAQPQEAPAPARTSTRAPLVAQQCASLEHKNTGGVSEDLWRVTNSCGFPVKVIFCFYDGVKHPKCGLKSDVGWGTTDTIPAGKFHYAVSALPPQNTKFWYFICDMRKGGLCLKPDATVAKR